MVASSRIVDLRPSEHAPRFHRVLAAQRPPPANRGEFADTVRKLWRHRLSILAFGVGGAALAFLAVLPIPSRYVAESRVLIGSAQPRILSLDSIVGEVSSDAEHVQSEALILQSRGLLQETIRRLHLDANPEFNLALVPASHWREMLRGVQATLVTPVVDTLKSAIGMGRPESDAAVAQSTASPEDAMVQMLLSRIDVSLVGRSLVLSVKAQAQNADVAASIANTLVQLYLEQQRQDKIGATGQAEKFLDQRTADLRQQVQAADQAVEKYRQRTGLFKGPNAGVAEQQLTEMNTQLTLAQAAKTEAESRLREAQATAIAGESVPDVLRSPVVQSLKQRFFFRHVSGIQIDVPLNPNRHNRNEVRLRALDDDNFLPLARLPRASEHAQLFRRDFPVGQTTRFARLVRIEDRPVGSDTHYGVGIFVRESCEAQDAFLGLFVFGDITCDAEGSDDVPVLIAQGHLARQKPRCRVDLANSPSPLHPEAAGLYE